MNFKFLSLILLVGLVFTSCSKKDDFKKEDKVEKKECIYVLFPQSWMMPDGSEITLVDKEDSALKDWYEANPDSDEKPEVVYPAEIKNKAGEIVTINNEDEMILAKKDCEEYNKKICIYVFFPQSWMMPDGSEITLENKEDSAMKDWYLANPDSDEKPELIYPVDIKNQNGIVETISNEEEMIVAKEDCEVYDKEDCIYLLFPNSWTMPDGTEITLMDKKDAAIKKWYKLNPKTVEKPKLIYPGDIKNQNGEIQMINNEEEMILAKEDCEVFDVN